MAYPNINNDPDLIKIKNKHDYIKELKKEQKKHDDEIILESLKIHND